MANSRLPFESDSNAKSLEPLDKTYRRIHNLPRRKKPSWLRRRLDVVEELLSNPAFIKDIKRLRKFDYEKLSIAEREDLFVQLFIKYKIPQDLYQFLFSYVLEGVLNFQQIQPPIEYFSYYAKMEGPHPYPYSLYRLRKDMSRWSKRASKELKTKVDVVENRRLDTGSTKDPNLYLKIYPGTTKQELLDFVNDFYDEHLRPALSIKTYNDLFNRRRIKKRPKIERDHRIMELHLEGKSAEKILSDLADEGYEITEPARINQIIKRLRGRSSIDYSKAETSEKGREMVMEILKKNAKDK